MTDCERAILDYHGNAEAEESDRLEQSFFEICTYDGFRTFNDKVREGPARWQDVESYLDMTCNHPRFPSQQYKGTLLCETYAASR